MPNQDPKEQLGDATELSPQVVRSIPQPVVSEHQVSPLIEEDKTCDADNIDVTSETVETGKEKTGESQGYTLPPRSTRAKTIRQQEAMKISPTIMEIGTTMSRTPTAKKQAVSSKEEGNIHEMLLKMQQHQSRSTRAT
ncbi:unnamed protein product [Amaranthus hypochondriacus]